MPLPLLIDPASNAKTQRRKVSAGISLAASRLCVKGTRPSNRLIVKCRDVPPGRLYYDPKSELVRVPTGIAHLGIDRSRIVSRVRGRRATIVTLPLPEGV